VVRLIIGVLILAAQLTWVVSDRRPALWAPFHEHAIYSLRVNVDGGVLDTSASVARYGLPSWHLSATRDENWETNSLRFVTDRIEAVEATTTGPVQVELRATVNGEEQPPWRFSR